MPDVSVVEEEVIALSVSLLNMVDGESEKAEEDTGRGANEEVFM